MHSHRVEIGGRAVQSTIDPDEPDHTHVVDGVKTSPPIGKGPDHVHRVTIGPTTYHTGPGRQVSEVQSAGLGYIEEQKTHKGWTDEAGQYHPYPLEGLAATQPTNRKVWIVGGISLAVGLGLGALIMWTASRSGVYE